MLALITGATKGIGEAITKKFAAEGFDLALCARSIGDLQQLSQQLSEAFPTIGILVQPVDVRNRVALQAFAALVQERWKRLDVLVNNAGIFIPDKITREEEGALEQTMETNLYSAYHLTRALIPALKASDKGHIFNLCSVASLFAYPNGGSYSISKFALLGFSKVLREELKQQGVRVTAVVPGATWTDSWAGSPFPAERMMPAADIAEAVWSAYSMSERTVVEEILLRPQLGDL